MHIISFDAYGWRAKNGDEINVENVARIADGLGAYWSDKYDNPVIYIGYDSRIDSGVYARVIAQVLSRYDIRPRVSDRMCPITALNYTAAHDDECMGAVMVTASSSSAQYNGVSFRNEHGCNLSYEDLRTIEGLIPTEYTLVDSEVEYVDIIDGYLDSLRLLVDTELIANSGLTVLLDPMYGSSKDILATFLADMGLDVIEMHGDDSFDFEGMRPRVQEPWIDECERATVNLGADVGFALDGDGDRVAVIDSTGHFIGPHKLATLIALHLVEDRGWDGRLCMPVTGSSYLRRAAQATDRSLSTVPMGFSWQVQEMLKSDVCMGSDTQGGLAYAAHLQERDGFLTILFFLEMMAYRNQSVSELVDGLEGRFGKLYYGNKAIGLDSAVAQMLNNILPGYNPSQIAGRIPVAVTHGDGLRVDFEDGSWALMRPSRTTQEIKIYAEAPSPLERDELMQGMVQISKEIFE